MKKLNIGIIGGYKLQVLPFAEVNYSALPAEIPPIMSYAVKFASGVEQQLPAEKFKD